MINQLTIKKGTPNEKTIRIEVIGNDLNEGEELMVTKMNELLSAGLAITCERPEWKIDVLLCLGLESLARVMLGAVDALKRGRFPF